jgi:hypothetical protein
MSMLQRFFPNKRASILFISGLLVLLLVPALLLVHPRTSANASGGGGGGPSVSIFQNPSSPGTTITVVGSGYPTNVTVKVFFQTPSNGVVTTATDGGGFFQTPLTVLSKYVRGVKYFVHVNSSTISMKILFTFTKPSLSVFGQFGPTPTFGSPVSVNGNGFAANEAVDLVWNDNVSGMMTAGLAGADSNGSFFTSLNMPSFPAGSQLQLIATGRISGVTASSLVHETPAVFAIPTMGTVGTTVKLNGGGFGSNEGVQILFQNTPVVTATTGPQGDFTTSFSVPVTAKIGFGFNNIVASGKTSGVAATASFSVEPNLSISPNSGPSFTLITVRGSHFTPSGFVEILWIFPGTGGSGGSGGGQLFITVVSTSASGTFRVTITAPGGLIPGQTSFVQAIDGPTGGSNQVKFHAL